MFLPPIGSSYSYFCVCPNFFHQSLSGIDLFTAKCPSNIPDTRMFRICKVSAIVMTNGLNLVSQG